MDTAVICRKKRVCLMDQNNSIKKTILSHLIQVGIPLFFSALSVYVSIHTTLTALNVKMDAVESKLTKLDEELDEANKSRSGEISGLSERIAILETRVEDNLNNFNNPGTSSGNHSGSSYDEDRKSNSNLEVHFLNLMFASPYNEGIITDSWSEINGFENNGSSTTVMQMQDPIAYDSDTQEEYTLDQLKDQKILMYYANDDENVFFYGQLDKDGFYSGDCIINVYEKGGSLKLITSANYLRGEMQDFVKVFPTKTKKGVDVWAVMDCTVMQGRKSGETWYYVRNSPHYQNIELDHITEDDIISAQDFLANYNTPLVGYYNGNISNGLFNDNTGNAYYIKYFDNGSVETLYMGRFQDGNFEDTTGNAWMISKNDINQKNYLLYRGPFVDGEAAFRDLAHWTPDMTQDKIDEYLEGTTLNRDLLSWSFPD